MYLFILILFEILFFYYETNEIPYVSLKLNLYITKLQQQICFEGNIMLAEWSFLTL